MLITLTTSIKICQRANKSQTHYWDCGKYQLSDEPVRSPRTTPASALPKTSSEVSTTELGSKKLECHLEWVFVRIPEAPIVQFHITLSPHRMASPDSIPSPQTMPAPLACRTSAAREPSQSWPPPQRAASPPSLQ